MFLEQVVTKPDPYAPFLLSQAIKANGFVFVSGQAAIGDNGEIVGEGDFDRQAEQAFGNLDRALKAAGSGLDKVVKVTIFLRSMENFAKSRRAAPQVVLRALSRRQHHRGFLALFAKSNDRDRGDCARREPLT